MALGFLATKSRSDVLNLSLPADLVPRLVDALDHLRASGAGELDQLALQLDRGGPLTARHDLLAELLAVAIDEAAERAARRAGELLRGEGAAPALRGQLGELGRLLDLYQGLGA